MNGQCLIITGMHRSHTSLLTQCLHLAGMYIGDNLLEANQYNSQGHFEHRDIVAFHENLIDEYQLRSKWYGIHQGALKKVKFSDVQR